MGKILIFRVSWTKWHKTTSLRVASVLLLHLPYCFCVIFLVQLMMCTFTISLPLPHDSKPDPQSPCFLCVTNSTSKERIYFRETPHRRPHALYIRDGEEKRMRRRCKNQEVDWTMSHGMGYCLLGTGGTREYMSAGAMTVPTTSELCGTE